MKMISIRERLKGTEELLSFGGFIEEALVEAYEEAYPKEIVRAVSKYCHYGQDFWEVADAVEDYCNAYPCVGDLRRYGPVKAEDVSEYKKWRIDNFARLEAARISDPEKNRPDTSELPEKIRDIFSDMNVLDQRIVGLRYGLFGGRCLKVEEIASLPEFSCDKMFIMKHISEIEKNTSLRTIFFLELANLEYSKNRDTSYKGGDK